MSKIPDTFCILPFIHLSTRTNGDMQLCCHTNSSSAGEYLPGCNRYNDKIVNLRYQNPEDYWNTDFYKKIRLQMLNNQKPEACSVCYREEEQGYRSKRLWETEEYKSKLDYNEIIKSVHKDGSMDFNIKYIDIKLGNSCNLACTMCTPADSNQVEKRIQTLKNKNISPSLKEMLPELPNESLDWYKDNTIFWDSIYNNLHNIISIYIIGGEPTINPEFTRLLKKCVKTNNANHIKLRFNTNGHYLTKELTDLYKEFNEVLIHLSMDGIEKYHELIRYPSKWETMLEVLEKHNKLAEYKNIIVDLDCTVSILNIEHIPDFIKWKVQSKYSNINKVSFRGLLGLHLLYYPMYLNTKILPKRDKIRITNKYKDLKKWLEKNKSTKASNYPKLQAIINYMNSEDLSHLYNISKEYIKHVQEIQENK